MPAPEQHRILRLVADGKSLPEADAQAAFHAVFEGDWSDAAIASLLTGLRARGETVDELVAGARVLRERMTPASGGHRGLLDTCGTGGDGSGTFNVSTATAILASCCGVKVAKHGNRSFSSATGSADVLRELGVAIDAGADVSRRCLDELGVAFFFAPLFHPAMKRVAAVRQELGFRTIFNFLGPLANPAGADYQLVGAPSPLWAEKLAHALARLGVKRASVVAGRDGLDEVTINGATDAFVVAGGAVTREVWSPADFGLKASSLESCRVNSAQESARVIREVLGGKDGPAFDLVLVNTAAALVTAEIAPSLAEGAKLARDAILSGRANRQLDALISLTRQAGGAA